MFESLLSLSFLFGTGLQPSSERGLNYFEVPQLRAALAYTNEDNDRMMLSFKGTDSRDATSKKNQIELDKAYLEVHSAFEDRIQLELGLVPNPWIAGQEQLWDFNYWGNDSEVFQKRYKYMTTSDLGVNVIWPMSSSATWIASFVNGEGNSKSENGPRKDISLILALENESWQSAWGYLRGAYDDYDSAVNIKERVMGRISYRSPDLSLSLEGFQGRDASLALTQVSAADGADFPANPVESIRSGGGSFTATVTGSEYWSFKFRYDALNPSMAYMNRSLTSGAIGAVNRLTRSLEQAFIYSRTDLQESHSLQSKVREKLLWALRFRMP